MRDEIFPIVTDDGCVVGQATRSECHSGSMLLHPVVHLHVITPDRKNVFLQRRAVTKKIQPGVWDTAVGGHVDFGEEVFSALIRESREELYIDASGATFVCRYVFQSDVERELINVFYVIMDSDMEFHADENEVSDARFWSVEEIERSIGTGLMTPNFESEYREVVLPKIIGGL